MGVRLQFEGIRCFSTPQDAVIRPLTLLVGENSSGKTTFLALCRIAHAIAQGPVRHLPFNEPPFLLGAYDQIASHRAGRHGHVKRFSLTISADTGAQSVRAEFVPKNGQPSLHVLRLTAGSLALEVSTDETQGCIYSLHGSHGEKRILGKEDGLPAVPESLFMSLMANPIEARTSSSLTKAAFSDSDFESLESARQAIRQEFRGELYAFAPIRTSPKRTYDPVDTAPEPEGSHVPMILARLFRSAATLQWTRLRSVLRDFGSKSGLFEDIEIVNKGKKESDPFQVGVTSGSLAFNLIDVGYGVSQALPILVDVLQRPAPFQLFLV